MQLREYQEQLVSRVRDAWIHGKKAPCIVLPCGGGKSCIVAEMAKRTTDNKKRVLFLVHRKELCAQIENTFRRWGVDMLRCSVMMVQTASRRIGKLPKPALIITDENHHSTAASYRKVYEAFPEAKRVGVTATPVRLDGSGLGDVNDMRWACQNSKTITSSSGNITYGKIEPKSRKTDPFKAFVAAECVSECLNAYAEKSDSSIIDTGIFTFD